MAEQASAGHKLGQLIGDWWEQYVVMPVLQGVAEELELFLDNRFVERPGRTGEKIIWRDEEGNAVDYDFVMELNGTPDAHGVPVAFFEVFWRRGARHSKDKSRDDSGKLLPMRDTYPTARFLGIAGSGEFTGPAKALIQSRGIDLFYVSKERIIKAFLSEGLTMDYPDRLAEEKKATLAAAFEARLSDEVKRKVAEALLNDLGAAAVEAYSSKIRSSLSAVAEEVRIIQSNHSNPVSFDSLSAAAEFLDRPTFSFEDASTTFRYEVSYSDGSEFSREVPDLEELRKLHGQLTELAEHMNRLAEKKKTSYDAAHLKTSPVVGEPRGDGAPLNFRVIEQGDLFSTEKAPRRDTSTTFVGNLALPVHKWFRYSAGFSAEWVRDVLQRERANGRCRVLDPFAGSGTVALEGELAGMPSIGLEAHPFIVRVAQAKLHWREDPKTFKAFAGDVLERAQHISIDIEEAPALIQKCFERDAYSRLAALVEAWRERADDSPISELTWLAVISIIRSCSTAGTAQWQYVLPNKEKKNVADPFEAFQAKFAAMARDMMMRQRSPADSSATISLDDARTCETVEEGWADLIITSPPYANNYDYADATRLELTVLGEIEQWKDLQKAVRRHLLPSCTQHVTKHRDKTYEILKEPLLNPLRPAISRVCQELESVSAERKGKKAYHTLVAAYFANMARVWVSLRRVTAEGGRACFVVGDSAPYGVYVPVDEWLGELALAAGFKSYSFEKTRDRNVKWKNRKHRVPLHEGRLWVEG